MKKDNNITNEWLDSLGKEKIQAFQDSFAKAFNISLCLLSRDCKTLTVWSNSSLFCHNIISNNKNRCIQERKTAIQHVINNENTYIFNCYMGITIFFYPVFYKKKIICIACGGAILEQNMYSNILLDNKKINIENVDNIVALLNNSFELLNSSYTNKITIKDENKNNELLLLKNKISRRELEIVNLINKGLTNKDIAAKLSISEKTVKTHVSNILAKLKLKDRIQLLIFCRENSI